MRPKRAGEEQPEPSAKRLRTDSGKAAISVPTTTPTVYTDEEHGEDAIFDWALINDSVDDASEDEPSIVSVREDLLYTGDALNADTDSEGSLVCYGMVSGRLRIYRMGLLLITRHSSRAYSVRSFETNKHQTRAVSAETTTTMSSSRWIAPHHRRQSALQMMLPLHS